MPGKAWLEKLGLLDSGDGQGARESTVTPHKHCRGYSEEQKSDLLETKTLESDGLDMF